MRRIRSNKVKQELTTFRALPMPVKAIVQAFFFTVITRKFRSLLDDDQDNVIIYDFEDTQTYYESGSCAGYTIQYDHNHDVEVSHGIRYLLIIRFWSGEVYLKDRDTGDVNCVETLGWRPPIFL